jgi:hypothetical protein
LNDPLTDQNVLANREQFDLREEEKEAGKWGKLLNEELPYVIRMPKSNK